ncbi:MAG: hypothetical protein HYY20_12540 [Candidatus Tectomicrobia bacterium]|uniref:Uncharacterized protein n=1 Tax=Tectimicrobiota bacterium TaxID=2528274 RepID=A0A932CR13_UNCTE|nr:hypothetical protein [Candidatus Tectomicrobia bacterium]
MHPFFGKKAGRSLILLAAIVPWFLWRTLRAEAEDGARWIPREVIEKVEATIQESRKARARPEAKLNLLKVVPLKDPKGPGGLDVALTMIDWYNGIYLLKRQGGGYRVVWNSEDEELPLQKAGLLAQGSLIQEEFSLEDVDQDGAKEIFFVWHKGGGEGTMEGDATTLGLYLPQGKMLFAMLAERQTWPYPLYPGPKFSASADLPPNKVYRSWMEKKGHEMGLMEGSTIDPDNPAFALSLWFAQNGPMRNGPVQLREYPGPLLWGTPLAAEVSDKETTWKAFQQGPVFGHDRTRDAYYVVYAPESMERWSKALAVDDRFLWIGTQGDGLIRYDKAAKSLKQILKVGKAQVPKSISSLKLEKDKLIVNRTLTLSRKSLSE